MLTVRTCREADGHWIAEVPALSGVVAYGTDRDEAIRRLQTLALRVLADRLDAGEETQALHQMFSDIGPKESNLKRRPTDAATRSRRPRWRTWLRWADRALVIGGDAVCVLSFMALVVSLWWTVGYSSYPDRAIGIGAGAVFIAGPQPASPISVDDGWFLVERERPMAWWDWAVSAWYVRSPLWFWATLGAAFAMLGFSRIRRRQEPGLCPKCVYDLTGLPVGKCCPECGHLIVKPTATEN